ncbi:DUF4262 domain-containing protein [Gordonia sp. NPDC003376]
MADHAAAIAGLPRWHPDPLVRGTIDTIRRAGWAVTAVGDACTCGRADCVPPLCAFAYTSGMGLHDIPELVVYGLDSRTATVVLNTLGHLLHRHDGEALVDREVAIDLTGTFDAPIRLIEVVDKSDLLISNELFPDLPALQVVWADELGTFPWEAGYTLRPMQQPVKGVPRADGGFVRGQRTVLGANRAQRRAARRRTPRE